MTAIPRSIMDAVEVSYRVAPRPRALLSFCLLVLGSLGWLGQTTPLTRLISVLLIGVGGALAWSGWPHRRRIRIADGQILFAGRRLATEAVERLELQARNGEHLGRARPTYTLELVERNGTRVELFECADPDTLVERARRLAPRIPTVVGWSPEGSELGAWLEGSPSSGPAAFRRLATNASISGHARPRWRKAVWITSAITLGLTVAILVFVVRGTGPAGAFSLALACLPTLLMTVLTLAIATERTTFLADPIAGSLRYQHSVFGRAVRTRHFRPEAVRQIVTLHADGEAGHVLIVTDEEPWCALMALPEARRVPDLVQVESGTS